ncbi:hypothetical protein [Neisseria musculi]|uniref:hypothetical protein n=1 Tax=Neisseria musculi TaxID=1815583 RepID=UPI00164B7022|nr:hypothetical protein [Neisseria musculi]
MRLEDWFCQIENAQGLRMGVYGRQGRLKNAKKCFSDGHICWNRLRCINPTRRAQGLAAARCRADAV